MIKRRMFIGTAAVISASVCSADSVAALLYGVDLNSQRLFSVDTATGSVQLMMRVPEFDTAGLGTASDGSLYMTQWISGAGVSNLYRIDVSSQATQHIGVTTSANFQSFEILDDVGYGISSGQLKSVNLQTAAVTTIGPIAPTGGNPNHVFNNYGGLAGADGVLYAYGKFNDEAFLRLITVDTSTGSMIETIDSMGSDQWPIGLAHAEGSLWTVYGGYLRRFDLDSHQWHVGFHVGIGNGVGMTTAIPTPGVLASIGLGLLCLRRRRRE